MWLFVMVERSLLLTVRELIYFRKNLVAKNLAAVYATVNIDLRLCWSCTWRLHIPIKQKTILAKVKYIFVLKDTNVVHFIGRGTYISKDKIYLVILFDVSSFIRWDEKDEASKRKGVVSSSAEDWMHLLRKILQSHEVYSAHRNVRASEKPCHQKR